MNQSGIIPHAGNPAPCSMGPALTQPICRLGSGIPVEKVGMAGIVYWGPTSEQRKRPFNLILVTTTDVHHVSPQ